MKEKGIFRFAAAREARDAGFTVKGIARNDRRWIHVFAPQGDEGVLFRVGANKWHWFSWKHEWTGSGHDPLNAMSGCLGDVIGTDGELRAYRKQMQAVPGCYLTQCAGLYRASCQART